MCHGSLKSCTSGSRVGNNEVVQLPSIVAISKRIKIISNLTSWRPSSSFFTTTRGLDQTLQETRNITEISQILFICQCLSNDLSRTRNRQRMNCTRGMFTFLCSAMYKLPWYTQRGPYSRASPSKLSNIKGTHDSLKSHCWPHRHSHNQ